MKSRFFYRNVSEMNFDIEEEHYFITLNGINAEVTIDNDTEFKEIKFKNALLDGSGKHTVELIKGKFSLVLCHLDDNQEIGLKLKLDENIFLTNEF